MTTPLDEYFGSKTAGFGGDVAKKIPGALTMAAAGGIAAAGVQGASSAAQMIMDAIGKRNDFRSMLEQNADLPAYQQSNPKYFNQVYSSLRAVNPAYAKDPLIAGHYLRQAFTQPGVTGALLTQAMHDVKPQKHPFMEAVTQGGLSGAQSSLGGKGEDKERGGFGKRNVGKTIGGDESLDF